MPLLSCLPFGLIDREVFQADFIHPPDNREKNPFLMYNVVTHGQGLGGQKDPALSQEEGIIWFEQKYNINAFSKQSDISRALGGKSIAFQSSIRPLLPNTPV